MQTTHNVQTTKDAPLSNQKTTQKVDQKARSIPDSGSNIGRDVAGAKPHFDKDKPAGNAMWAGDGDTERDISKGETKGSQNRPIEQQAQSRPLDKQKGINQAPQREEQLPKKAPAKTQN